MGENEVKKINRHYLKLTQTIMICLLLLLVGCTSSFDSCMKNCKLREYDTYDKECTYEKADKGICEINKEAEQNTINFCYGQCGHLK